jgi:8-oxo-dGTP pyrophosphatase MutT (NUDIX family)
VSVPASWAAVQHRLARLLSPPAAGYLPLRVDGHVAGWITPPRAARLAGFGDVFRVTPNAAEFVPNLTGEPARTAALAAVATALASEGALSGWRDERYDIGPNLGAQPWFRLERAAARYFGVQTYAVHVNGLVATPGGPKMWFARRSPRKALDPGKLDNLVGGGLSSASTVQATLAKEAWEEAGIPRALADRAVAAGPREIHRDQPDGLQRETIFVHDLWLPAAFAPRNQDGEVTGYRLVDFAEAARLIGVAGGPDEVTADASLVALDCLLRNGALSADAPEWAALRAFGSGPA